MYLSSAKNTKRKKRKLHTFAKQKVTKQQLTNAERQKKIVSLCLRKRLLVQNGLNQLSIQHFFWTSMYSTIYTKTLLRYISCLTMQTDISITPNRSKEHAEMQHAFTITPSFMMNLKPHPNGEIILIVQYAKGE